MLDVRNEHRRQNLTKSSHKIDNKIYIRHSYALSLEQFSTLNYVTLTIAYKDQIEKPVNVMNNNALDDLIQRRPATELKQSWRPQKA